eukprot:5994695-Lingulodinium_polyedra.AAC.1
MPTESATANCSSAQLVDLLPKWTTFLGYPKRWHADQEGCFQGDSFMAWCNTHHINIAMVAGEAHWQN